MNDKMSSRIPRRIYKDMDITFGELAQALRQLGFKDKSDSEIFHFESPKAKLWVRLRQNQPTAFVPKIHIAANSTSLWYAGIIEEWEDLAKLVEQNRLKNNQPALAKAAAA
jgi:hypothetical protein